MAARKRRLHLSITEHIAKPVVPFEEMIARSLNKKGEYRGHLTSDQLSVILRKVLFTLVAEQKVAGMDVPIVHNVSATDVTMSRREARVFAEVHVHTPVTAFIQFRYCLENGNPGSSKSLRLKGNQVEVKEITRPLDFGAKAALRIMAVRNIALRELRDPNAVALVELSRAGWPNGAGTPRGTGQRVRYRLEDGKLIREHWMVMDATLATQPVKRELLTGVQRVAIRYLTAGREWITEWPQYESTADLAFYQRPLAIEFTIVLEDWGEIRRLVEVAG